MSSQLTDRADIYARLPHAGPMRLLDAVLFWDESSIWCRAASHADRTNPLRRNGGLSNVHALEYAAQAIAVHGSLLDGDGPVRLVYVASFRDVELEPGPLHRHAGAALEAQATQLAATPGGWIYEFSVTSAGAAVAQGKAAVAVAGEAS